MKKINWHLPQLGIIKHNIFTGSTEWMRYSLQKDNDVILAKVWPQPWAIEKTNADLINCQSFALSDEGKQQAQAWFEEMVLLFPTEKRENIFTGLPEGWVLPWEEPNRQAREEKEKQAQQQTQEE